MSKKIAFAIFTDLHLGVHSDSDYWLAESKEWTTWFIAECEKRGIKEVLFSGDWYHQRHEICVKTLDAAHELQEKFRASSIRTVHSIAGNHDCYFKEHAKVNSLKLLSSPFKIYDDTTVINLGGLDIAMVPWGCQPPSEVVDITVGHFDAVGFKMQKTRLAEHGYSPTDLLKTAKLVLSGHFHLRQKKTYADGEMIFVGNPFQCEFGDAGEDKGFLIVYTDASYEFVNYETGPQHHYLKLSDDVKLASLDGVKKLILSLQIDSKETADGEHREKIEAIKLRLKPDVLRIDDITSDDAANDTTGVMEAQSMGVKELFSSFVETSLTNYDEQIKKDALTYILDRTN